MTFRRLCDADFDSEDGQVTKTKFIQIQDGGRTSSSKSFFISQHSICPINAKLGGSNQNQIQT